jgi:hypothetical protein
MRPSWLVCLATFPLALAGCPPPAETPSRPTDASAAPPSDAEFTADERAQSNDKLGGPWTGCYATYQPQGDPMQDLARLALACGRPTGLAPVTPARPGDAQGEGDAAERFAFRARAGRCYRVLAVGDSNVIDLDVAVIAPDGRLAAADVSHDRWPIVPPRGPLCVGVEGVYAIEAAVVRGSGRYALQVLGD